MSEFKPIETQEELNDVLRERLKRERDAVKKEYEGFLSPDEVAKKYKGYLSPEEISEKYEGYLSPEEKAALDKRLKGYESDSVKTRIARELSLPYEAVQFLSGEDEDAIRKNAEALKVMVGAENTAPLASVESATQDAKDAAMRNMVKGLKGE